MNKYRMYSEVVTSHPDSDSIQPVRTLYTRLIIYYCNKEFHRVDLFGEDKYKVEEIYNNIVKQHSREKKINYILK